MHIEMKLVCNVKIIMSTICEQQAQNSAGPELGISIFKNRYCTQLLMMINVNKNS